MLFDFGKELFGKLCITGVSADDVIYVCYGESPEEASDKKDAIIRETISGKTEYELKNSFLFLVEKEEEIRETYKKVLPEYRETIITSTKEILEKKKNKLEKLNGSELIQQELEEIRKEIDDYWEFHEFVQKYLNDKMKLNKSKNRLKEDKLQVFKFLLQCFCS